MYYRLIVMFVAALSLLSHADAAPIQLVFPESTYEPGSPLRGSIILPTGIVDLGAYEIQVSMVGNAPTAGADYGFDLTATDAAASMYVFSADDLFFDTVLTDSVTSQTLILTDLTSGAGVDVTTDVNDRVADFVVYTSASYTGPLIFSINANSLILDSPTGSEIEQAATIRAAIAADTPVTIVVPEPGTVRLWAIVVAACVTCRRRTSVSRR
jgi:hypothetical protein